MSSLAIINANLVNEGKIFEGSLLVKNGRIEKISTDTLDADEVIDAKGRHLLPGIIDDQVHFRDPGATYKGDLATESRAAIAGGITSYMDMPNTKPNTLTQELLEEKYQMAKTKSLANYSFYMGAAHDNVEEVLKTNKNNICGIKIFMGASTGNMLVDDVNTLESIFSKSDMLIATHCEDETTIRKNSAEFKEKYGEDLAIKYHPQIRSEEACFLSSSFATSMAKKFGSRLHVLHLTTGREMQLFDNALPLEQKKITAEVCVHHLWFSDADYDEKGTLIKWNPAVKTAADRDALFEAMLANTIDVIATDHAPHTAEEKANNYFNAPSGGPLVQHSLVSMIEHHLNGKISLERIVEKMCHAPAICFQVKERGYLREGYHADLTLVDLNSPWQVEKENILYKCGWSPFEGTQFRAKVDKTIVNGHVMFDGQNFSEARVAERLVFDR